MIEQRFNFAAGPSTLPPEVKEQASAAILDWRGKGSVLELVHRSSDFRDLLATTETQLRDLLAIPENYKVLFLQGGATGQFAAIPLNLTRPDQTADYIVNGIWGKKATDQAKSILPGTHIAATATPYTYVPDQQDWQLSEDAAYLHITKNETINGVYFPTTPLQEAPLVADMSSIILSEPLTIANYGVIYASTQKNVGIPGVTIVIVREDLLEQARPDTPDVWNWKTQAQAESMINTPPTFSIYMAHLVLTWLQAQGGVSAIAELNQRKAQKLYDAIDGSELYTNSVVPAYRSLMNIPFVFARPNLEAAFFKGAQEAGIDNTEGHRDAGGGARISLFNAMPIAGVDKVIDYMQEFERTH